MHNIPQEKCLSTALPGVALAKEEKANKAVSKAVEPDCILEIYCICRTI